MTVFSQKGIVILRCETPKNLSIDDCMRSLTFVRDDIAVLLNGFALKNLLTIVVRDSSHTLGMAMGCCPQNAVIPTTVGKKDLSQNKTHVILNVV